MFCGVAMVTRRVMSKRVFITHSTNGTNSAFTCVSKRQIGAGLVRISAGLVGIVLHSCSQKEHSNGSDMRLELS